MTEEILECGHPPSPHESFTTGYGVDSDGNRHCYQCCADQDDKLMQDDERITLYLTKNEEGAWKVCNWPSSLVFPAFVQISPNGHNWGLTRRDAWFFDRRGDPWWGVQFGENTELIHCRRLKHYPVMMRSSAWRLGSEITIAR
jgi:hypothetical protein